MDCLHIVEFKTLEYTSNKYKYLKILFKYNYTWINVFCYISPQNTDFLFWDPLTFHVAYHMKTSLTSTYGCLQKLEHPGHIPFLFTSEAKS